MNYHFNMQENYYEELIHESGKELNAQAAVETPTLHDIVIKCYWAFNTSEYTDFYIVENHRYKRLLAVKLYIAPDIFEALFQPEGAVEMFSELFETEVDDSLSYYDYFIKELDGGPSFPIVLFTEKEHPEAEPFNCDNPVSSCLGFLIRYKLWMKEYEEVEYVVDEYGIVRLTKVNLDINPDYYESQLISIDNDEHTARLNHLLPPHYKYYGHCPPVSSLKKNTTSIALLYDDRRPSQSWEELKEAGIEMPQRKKEAAD